MSVSKVLPVAALAALALIPSPAAAHAMRDGEMARELSDPRTQQAMGDMLGAMIGVMLDMRVDPLARAMEAMGEHDAARRIPRGARVSDMMGPEARRIPGEVRRRAPAMIGAMGQMAGVLEEMAPEFERIADDFDRKMAQREHD
ncbi:MAG: hypothetical protein ACKOPE_00990 [Novosphingobium sp.]